MTLITTDQRRWDGGDGGRFSVLVKIPAAPVCRVDSCTK